MIILDILYLGAIAGALTFAGLLPIRAMMRTGDVSDLATRLLTAFAVKMILGIAFFLIAWKVFRWSSFSSAVLAVGGYLIALGVVSITLFRSMKRMGR